MKRVTNYTFSWAKLWSLAILTTISTTLSAQQFTESFSGNPLSGEWRGRVSAQFGDIDGDGDPDAFLINDETILFYRNDGTSTEVSLTPVTGNDDPFDEVTVGLSGIAIGDTDADGDLDFFQIDVPNQSRFYKNKGSSTSPNIKDAVDDFVSLSEIENQDISQPFISYDRVEPSFADLDGDGDLDLLVGTGKVTTTIDECEIIIDDICIPGAPEQVFEGEIFYYENTGTSTSPAYSLATGSEDPFNDIAGSNVAFHHAAAADLDGDGDLDVVISNGVNVQHYENVGSATNPVLISGIDLTGETSLQPIISFVDIDGDNDQDIFLGGTNGAFRLFENLAVPNLHAIKNDEAIELRWTASDADDVSHYNIYGGSSGGDEIIAEVDASTTTFTDNSVGNGTLNYYRVTRVDSEGTEVAYSLEEGGVANNDLGNHLSFNSSGAHVEVANDRQLRTPVGTVEFWMKLSKLPDESAYFIIGKHNSTSSLNGWHITHSGTELGAQIKNGGSTIENLKSGLSLNDDEWHHVAFTFQLDGMSASKLYVDGELVDEIESSPKVNLSSQPLRMGASLDGFWNRFPGELEEVRFWNYVRSADEIADNYRVILPGDTEGLIAYWSFDEPAGTETTFDGGVNGFDGEISDGADFESTQDLNAEPTLENELQNLTLTEGFETEVIDLSEVFSDPDADVLVLTASSKNEDILTVELSDQMLTINEGSIGSSKITVVADDQFGGTISDKFTVTIEPLPTEEEEEEAEEIVTAIDIEESAPIKVYPNPVTSYLSIESGGSRVIRNITVLNNLGMKVLQSGNLEADNRVIDLTPFDTGLYLVLIETSDGLEKHRILIR